MLVLLWITVVCFIWLLGLSLLAEIWFYEEEQESSWWTIAEKAFGKLIQSPEAFLRIGNC